MDNQPSPLSSRDCSTCAFAVKTILAPPNIGSELKCQFMPPQLVLLPTNQGPQLITMFPTVTDKQLCAQHAFAHETANAPQKILAS